MATELGLSPIDQIQEGENVLSYDFALDQWFARPVLSTMRRQYQGDIVTIALASDQIRCTGDHPFWVTHGIGLSERPEPAHVHSGELGSKWPGRWVDARDLRVGDVLPLRIGQTAAIHTLTVQGEATLKSSTWRWQNLNNYCVGKSQVLVQ